MATDVAVEAILEALERADTLEEITKVSFQIREAYNVTHVVYYWVNSVGENYGAGTFTEEWTERYLEKGYNKIDPVVLGCFQRFEPMNWKSFNWSTKAARDFLKDALDHGVGSQGLAIPIRGPNGQYAVFTVNDTRSDEDWEKFFKLHKRDFMVIAYEFNKKGLEFEKTGNDMTHNTLSPRELAAMTYIARGLSRAQAANLLNISEHTLRVYIESARHKLGALNTTHAVARAINTGLIVA